MRKLQKSTYFWNTQKTASNITLDDYVRDHYVDYGETVYFFLYYYQKLRKYSFK